ncbi:Gfo/Idh/MocA family oxidoreductase [Octadecabacter sp. 1_MG-2023]|uniref:Gfo/Idh/MocA family protein n=1 Tax=unclassified Octadecabacter TaxID=196158 RepID=UPI001C099664|nr:MULTISPECIES: Gfo/Idh/MocA family oxidoreductase [unclassified Octadecabacter]MBU2994066.1 Gfo/Idh/MocA family oxidoreductase [Octadecabacter sp. B2R22]MDO6736080.1 Gfo/Idh/MocA family oxidoreductase [Octadecabacter sp. 1_MG-2023]
MKIGFIGCGYVFDHYMTTLARHPSLKIAGVCDIDAARATRVGDFYNLKVYDSAQTLLADATIDTVVNLTSIPSHYSVSRAILEAGKHLYSEKPLTMTMEEAHALADLAKARNLRLSAAPSNALSATVQTLWSLVDQGAVGDVRMVYAEFDDNPVYLLSPEKWVSRSGAPWPYLHEYEMGCTWEHAGYHLGWMCMLFGPVRHVTAFSRKTLPDKTDQPLEPAGTPDFSVATLDFENGVVARLTCSIAAPVDHRMRIIGNRGEVSADTYRHYEAPVRLDPFVPFSLKARNAASIRRHSVLGALFGVGGRRVPLLRTPPPGDTLLRDEIAGQGPKAWLKRLRRREFGQQDKCLGLAELADAINTNRAHFPSPAFTLHITELTLAIQGAGPDGACQRLTTRFDPMQQSPQLRAAAPDYIKWTRLGPVPRFLSKILSRAGARRA